MKPPPTPTSPDTKPTAPLTKKNEQHGHRHFGDRQVDQNSALNSAPQRLGPYEQRCAVRQRGDAAKNAPQPIWTVGVCKFGAAPAAHAPSQAGGTPTIPVSVKPLGRWPAIPGADAELAVGDGAGGAWTEGLGAGAGLLDLLRRKLCLKRGRARPSVLIALAGGDHEPE